MTVWIKIEGDIDKAWRPLFVSERQEASVLSSANAQQAIRKLDDNHHQYKWESVPAQGKDERVIKGEEKSKK
jgi:hypothetical protein